jgi:hypothetical protein
MDQIAQPRQMLNPYVTDAQERLRELVFLMYKEEAPVSGVDMKALAPFIKVVREETVEDTTPGKRGIRRISYCMLNNRGRRLYRQWLTGRLDHLA